MPVVFFSSDVNTLTEITLEDHKDRIDRIGAGLGSMGGTNYHRAMEAVIRHYQESGSTAPALVLFQTDGEPNSKSEAERCLCKAAKLPIFWQFIGFGDQSSGQFRFLRKLRWLAVPQKRPINNAGFFALGRDPRRMSNAKLYDRMLSEFPTWLAAARSQGIVSTGPDGRAIVRPANGPDRQPLADQPPFTGPGPALQDTSPPAPDRRGFRARLFGR